MIETPPEIVFEILKNLTPSEAINLCRSNRHFQSYCNNWIQLLRLKYPERGWSGISNREAIDMDRLLSSSKWVDFLIAIEKGYMQAVEYFIQILNFDPVARENSASIMAIVTDNFEIFKYLHSFKNTGVDDERNYEMFMRASESDRLNVVQYLLDNYTFDLNDILLEMCAHYSGIDALQYLLERYTFEQETLNSAIEYAIVSSDEIFIQCLLKNASFDQEYLKEFLIDEHAELNSSTVEYLIENFTFDQNILNDVLIASYQNENVGIAEYLLENFVFDQETLDNALMEASSEEESVRVD